MHHSENYFEGGKVKKEVKHKEKLRIEKGKGKKEIKNSERFKD